ncbi:hypothetical protein PHISCL_07222 [Aspergillus sclerotialis]|uniref:Uncharacterized protein n=1 Tax=Aspergillus sclerotialis TaxID=2070753 RepID=A0A3A2ZBX8_9EURO|nr:hypothetical protein PHISCL_07222 [Aspergillus sclerotialis]
MSNSAGQRTLKNMSQEEINLFAEWDPAYLETLEAEASPATKKKIPMKLQDMNVSRSLKPQCPTTFEEWRASATANAPQNVKENVAAITDRFEKVNLAKSSPPSIGSNSQQSTPTSTGSSPLASTINPTAQVFTPKSIVSSDTYRNVNMDQNTSTSSTKEPQNITDSKHITEALPARRVQEGFTAPNGLFIHNRELARLSLGVKLDNNSTLYFRPSFVTDPWKNVKAMKTTCLSRY